MNRISIRTAVGIALLVSVLAWPYGSAWAQPSSAPPLPPTPGLVPPGQSGSEVEGTIAQYLMNPHGEVDGLLLSNGIQVHFPPHMEKSLVAVAKPQDVVRAEGYRSVEGPVMHAYVITNTTTGQSIIEREPSLLDRPILPPHIRDRSLVERHAEGVVRNLLYGPRGELNGAVLEDRTIVRVPPHATYHVARFLQIGQSISAVGYGTENAYGRAIEATALGASGSSMLSLDDPDPRGFRR